MTKLKLSHEANDCARAISAIVKQTTGADLPMEACVRIAGCAQVAINSETEASNRMARHLAEMLARAGAWVPANAVDTKKALTHPVAECRTRDAVEKALQEFSDFASERGIPLDDAPNQKPAPGHRLEVQPDGIEPEHYTHFDMWPGRPESDYSAAVNREAREAKWEGGWKHPESVKLANELVDEWEKETGVDLSSIRGRYLELGQARFFEECEKLLVEGGLSVYSSDTVFEIYPGHVKDEVESDGIPAITPPAIEEGPKPVAPTPRTSGPSGPSH